jgi:hypothetical protein
LLNYLLGLVALLVIWLVFRRYQARKREQAEASSRSASPRRKSPYHAVSIRVGRSACLAAKTLEGRRYLATEAPQLPLAECSMSASCECRFIHHDDRRSGRDRRSPFAPGGVGTGTARLKQERRHGSDRRDSAAESEDA